MPLLRVRFKANAEDYRPVNWPVKHPYWCSGYGFNEDGDYAIVLSYADDESYITTNWPEATELETTEVEGYNFTDRFPKPEWFSIETRCPYCNSDNEGIKQTYFDQTCEGCVKRMFK